MRASDIYFTPDANQIKTVKVPIGYEIKFVPIGYNPNVFNEGILTKNIQDLNGNVIINLENPNEVNILGKLLILGHEVVSLDNNGKIDSKVLPAISITSVTVIPKADTLDELISEALIKHPEGLQEGDVIICVDGNIEGSYIVTSPELTASDDLTKLAISELPEATTSSLGGVTLVSGATDAQVYNAQQINDIITAQTNLINNLQEQLNLLVEKVTQLETEKVNYKKLTQEEYNLLPKPLPDNTLYRVTQS